MQAAMEPRWRKESVCRDVTSSVSQSVNKSIKRSALLGQCFAEAKVDLVLT